MARLDWLAGLARGRGATVVPSNTTALVHESMSDADLHPCPYRGRPADAARRAGDDERLACETAGKEE